MNGAILMPAHGALGKDQRPWAGPALECAGNHLFRVAQAIDGSSVDPVNAQVKRPMNRGNRLVVVLGPPGELPVAAADGPGAKADGGELKVRVSKGAKRGGGSRSHNKRIDAGRPSLDTQISTARGPAILGSFAVTARNSRGDQEDRKSTRLNSSH